MKNSFLKQSVMGLFLVLTLAACGNKDSSSKSVSPTPVVDPIVDPASVAADLDSIITAFNNKPDVEGLAVNDIIQHTIATPKNVTPTGGTIGDILNFLNANIYNYTASYEFSKVNSIANGILKIQNGNVVNNQVFWGAIVTYSKASDAELNSILSLMNGSADLQEVRAVKFTYKNQQISGHSIVMAKNNKLYTYVLSAALPLIVNPVFTHNGETGATKTVIGLTPSSIQYQ
jgi:hypothetical protein